jgi:outer membrane protein OmpA-like peptidoglycan-associated protein
MTATLELDNLEVAAYQDLLSAAGLTISAGRLSSELNVSAQAAPGGYTVDLVGRAELDDLDASAAELRLTTGRLSFEADLNIATAQQPDQAAPTISGPFAIGVGDLGISTSEPPMTWLTLGELKLVDAEVASLEEIKADRLTLSDLLLSLHRDEHGRLSAIDRVMSIFAKQSNGFADETDKPADVAVHVDTPPFRFAIENIEVVGSSEVAFDDRSVEPAFTDKVVVERLQMRQLGNAEPQMPAQLELSLLEDEYSSLNASGTVRPFGEAISANLTLSVEGFDLHKISAYLPAYQVERGRLSVESTVDIDAGELDIQNNLILDKLKLAGKTEDDNTLLDQGMAMPLDVALDLLRDNEDRISLALPITGNIADPNVNTGDILRTAMQSAVQKAALSYVKNALQPLGAILLVAQVAGSAARPRFEPLTFEPGSTELSADGQAYLHKIADLMSERSALHLTFCGVATLQDHDVPLESEQSPPGDEAALLELAESRGEAVRAFLVQSRVVDPERLFACRPSYETDESALPRVEISL